MYRDVYDEQVPQPDATAPQKLPMIDPWQQLSKTLGDTSAGRANGRLQEALLSLSRDQLSNQQFSQGSTNALNQATFAPTARQIRANQSVQGDAMANAQDSQVSGLPAGVPNVGFSGGLRPSLLSENSRAYGRGLSRDALAAQLAGGDKIDFPTAPKLTPVPEAGLLDSALNAGSALSGIGSAASKLLSGGQPSHSEGTGNPIKWLMDKLKGKPDGPPGDVGTGPYVPPPPAGDVSSKTTYTDENGTKWDLATGQPVDDGGAGGGAGPEMSDAELEGGMWNDDGEWEDW